MIYNDFNQENIVVNVSDLQKKFEIIGLIDFNDMCYTHLLFDVAIGLAYMMYIQREGDRLATGREFMSGYELAVSLTDDEWALLPLCVASRCVQTILMGTYSYRQDPSNEYLRIDVEKATDALKFVRSVSPQDLVQAWRGQTT